MRAPKKNIVTRPTPIPRMPPAVMLRAFLLAALAVAACGWAILRHVARRAQVAAPAPSASAEPEQPVDLVPIE